MKLNDTLRTPRMPEIARGPTRKPQVVREPRRMNWRRRRTLRPLVALLLIGTLTGGNATAASQEPIELESGETAPFDGRLLSAADHDFLLDQVEVLLADLNSAREALRMEQESHDRRKIQVAQLEQTILELRSASEADGRELGIRRTQVGGLEDDITSLERRLTTSRIITIGGLGLCALGAFALNKGTTITLGGQ